MASKLKILSSKFPDLQSGPICSSFLLAAKSNTVLFLGLLLANTVEKLDNFIKPIESFLFRLDLFTEVGMRVEGTLFGWFETGLEGTVWALQADNDPGYGGLFVLDEGDHLVIISPSEDFLFSGYIVQDTEIGKTQRPSSKVAQPTAKGRWIHWTQKGYTPDDWATLLFSETNRAVLTKNTQSD